MKMTIQNKLHFQNLTHRLVGMGGGSEESWSPWRNNRLMASQIHREWSSSGCVASRGTTVEWVKRSQSRNCSLNMCHTLKCRGEHPYTHQYDEQKSPKPKLWSLYFCYRGEEKYSKTKIKHKTGEGGKKRLQILRWMQRRWTARVGWDTPAQGVISWS